MAERGARQRAFRQREKEKKDAVERHLEELSEKVSQLELKRQQLQGALGNATCDSEGFKQACERQSPEIEEVAMSFRFGESAVQLQLTTGEAGSLTDSALANIWQRLVHKMAWCLDKRAVVPTSRKSDFEQQIEGLVREAIEFLWVMVDHCPHVLNSLVTLNVENPSGPQATAGDTRDFPAILAAMELQEDQAAKLLAIRRSIMREVGALIAVRTSLLARLQSVEDVEEGAGCATTRFSDTARTMELLRSNMHSMHTCSYYHLSYLYTRILTPIQIARYVVGCLPFGPDSLLLTNCLAAQSGEPPIEELLKAKRPVTAAPDSGSADTRDPLLPDCDWRQGLEQPLRVLHAWPKEPQQEEAEESQAGI
ncbi:hypothetical protein COCOBI_06-6450 [Coccomyxa sp. Obi]|nr:hypothetical protein COCOBI_06-6450 [Coccomyxa sp. Obi]